MILVDSSVWIDYFRGTPTPEAEKLDLLLGTEPIATGDLILTEVLQGFVSDEEFDIKLNLLSITKANNQGTLLTKYKVLRV